MDLWVALMAFLFLDLNLHHKKKTRKKWNKVNQLNLAAARSEKSESSFSTRNQITRAPAATIQSVAFWQWFDFSNLCFFFFFFFLNVVFLFTSVPASINDYIIRRHLSVCECIKRDFRWARSGQHYKVSRIVCCWFARLDSIGRQRGTSSFGSVDNWDTPIRSVK